MTVPYLNPRTSAEDQRVFRPLPNAPRQVVEGLLGSTDDPAERAGYRVVLGGLPPGSDDSFNDPGAPEGLMEMALDETVARYRPQAQQAIDAILSDADLTRDARARKLQALVADREALMEQASPEIERRLTVFAAKNPTPRYEPVDATLLANLGHAVANYLPEDALEELSHLATDPKNLAVVRRHLRRLTSEKAPRHWEPQHKGAAFDLLNSLPASSTELARERAKRATAVVTEGRKRMAEVAASFVRHGR